MDVHLLIVLRAETLSQLITKVKELRKEGNGSRWKKNCLVKFSLNMFKRENIMFVTH